MRLLSPRELADALGVSESSLKRWVDAGKIQAARTEGGHRRITLSEAVRFVRETGAPVARPEILDMGDITSVRGASRSEEAFRHYLIEGDAAAARGWLLERYLAGEAVASLCDGPVKAAMYYIGELWQHDAEGVFIEHRATDVALQALFALRAVIDPPANAPLAIGCGPQGDPYIIPSMMAALVLSSVGVRTMNLGADTPVSALTLAVARHQPALVWISASTPLVAPDPLQEFVANSRYVIAVGGRFGDVLAAMDPRAQRFESMTELAAYGEALTTQSSGFPKPADV
ncbi:MAG: helix-turn-helix domain-containing protein [Kofleriaceae bacterium]